MGDGTSDAAEKTTLEGPAAAWLEERAEELDVGAAELLERVVAAYRAAEAGETPDVVTETELDDRLDAVEAEFQSELTDVDSEFSEKVADVRDRVIQVKRETDAKAPAGHDHPELADRATDALAAVDELEPEVVDALETLRRLSDRVDAGFENFEEVLTYLRDETDGLDRKLRSLATAVLAMRESVASVAAANARRDRADRLKRVANREGVRVADCEACGSELSIGLLTAPECPACGATFEDVEVNEGWFSSHQLVTGSAPALTAGEPVPSDEDDEWLGADTDTLEEMASGDTSDDDGDVEVVEPSTVEEHGAASGGEEHGAASGGEEHGAASGGEEHGAASGGEEHRAASGGEDAASEDAADAFRVDDAVDVGDEELDFDDEELNIDDEDLRVTDNAFNFDNGENIGLTDDGETND